MSSNVEKDGLDYWEESEDKRNAQRTEHWQELCKGWRSKLANEQRWRRDCAGRPAYRSVHVRVDGCHIITWLEKASLPLGRERNMVVSGDECTDREKQRCTHHDGLAGLHVTFAAMVKGESFTDRGNSDRAAAQV